MKYEGGAVVSSLFALKKESGEKICCLNNRRKSRIPNKYKKNSIIKDAVPNK